MSLLFDPGNLVEMLESLGINDKSISIKDKDHGEGIQVFPCGVQCEMLLGHAKYRGLVNSVFVSTTERFVVVDYEWCCIWSEEFKLWFKVGTLKSKIPYHEHYYQDDEDRVKIKHILKIPSARFFRMGDHTHIIETDHGFVARWYLPKMALFRMITIAMLAKK